jgi:multidrug efflux system outer membrane protein
MNSHANSSHLCRRATAVFGAVVLLLGSGCTVGPDYRAPAPSVNMTDWSATQTAATAVTRDAVADAWWTTFNDPMIGRLVERAWAASPDIEIAAQRVREARAGLSFAAGGELPRIGASASRTEFRRTGPLNTVYRGSYPTYQAGFDAGWELDLFGGTRRAIESA